MQPLQSLAGLNATFTAISVAAKSVFAIMDAPLQQDAGTVVRSEVQGNIDLCDVYVRYPESEQEALKGINLSIRAGEHVALIGHSGSGKTTTVNLLPRFVEASSGVVKIDGVDVCDFTLENLRKHIAIVSQDVFLFDATIRENVAYGFPQAEPAQRFGLDGGRRWPFAFRRAEATRFDCSRFLEKCPNCHPGRSYKRT